MEFKSMKIPAEGEFVIMLPIDAQVLCPRIENSGYRRGRIIDIIAKDGQTVERRFLWLKAPNTAVPPMIALPLPPGTSWIGQITDDVRKATYHLFEIKKEVVVTPETVVAISDNIKPTAVEVINSKMADAAPREPHPAALPANDPYSIVSPETPPAPVTDATPKRLDYFTKKKPAP